MKNKIIKINLPNMSPNAFIRQPLKNIINFTPQSTPKQHTKINSFILNKGAQISDQRKLSTTLVDSKVNNINLTQKKNSERNSLRDQTKSQRKLEDSNLNQCENHMDKMIKFKVFLDNRVGYYCEKCAILLASQGFKVQKIVNKGDSFNNIPSNKFTKISNDFLQEIHEFLSQNKNIKLINIKEKKEAQQYYESFLVKIQQLEQQLTNKIRTMMDEQRVYINRFFEQYTQKIELRMKQISNYETELQKICEDIQINLQTISELDESEFNPIIQQYKSRFNQYKTSIFNFSQLSYCKIDLFVPEKYKMLTSVIDDFMLKTNSLKVDPRYFPTTFQEMTIDKMGRNIYNTRQLQNSAKSKS